VSDYLINSALYAANEAGLFYFNVSSNLIPSSSPIKLDTTDLEGFVPGLVQKYGANKPVDLICRGLNNPIVNLSEPSSSHKSGLI